VGIDRLRQNYDIEVHWIAFPLHPETPEEGLTLEELFAGRSVDIPAIMERLRQVADELGLPFGERKKTYNSRLAQELAKWAESTGKGDAFHDALFRAYFVGARNIGKVEDIVEVAASIGLPGDEARSVCASRAFKEAVDADWARSRALKITAVPTFVIGDERVVGAQPYEVLEKFVKGCGAARRGRPGSP
jgi:predicted DsbA family dithiol-disulfide isomerase